MGSRKGGRADADDFMLEIGRILAEQDAKTAIINKDRIREVGFVYEAIKTMLLCDGWKLDYKLHEPIKSMASISVEGREVSFTNTKWFSRIAEFTDTIEVEPLVNGNVRVTFGFRGLTKPIE